MAHPLLIDCINTVMFYAQRMHLMSCKPELNVLLSTVN